MVSTRTAHPGTREVAHANEVRLVGRVSAPPRERTLPSGDVLVSLRVVVDRPRRGRGAAGGGRRASIDAIDIVCWTAQARRSAGSIRLDDTIEVSGALRRRFWRGSAGVASLCEVEARRVKRLARSPGSRQAE